MKDLIKKYLQEQVIDKVGETRPYIDPDFIDVYADDIEKLVKNNAVLPHVSKSLPTQDQAMIIKQEVADGFTYVTQDDKPVLSGNGVIAIIEKWYEMQGNVC